MQIKYAKCPNCGADFQVSNNRQTFEYKYCGSSVMLTDLLKNNPPTPEPAYTKPVAAADIHSSFIIRMCTIAIVLFLLLVFSRASKKPKLHDIPFNMKQEFPFPHETLFPTRKGRKKTGRIKPACENST